MPPRSQPSAHHKGSAHASVTRNNARIDTTLTRTPEVYRYARRLRPTLCASAGSIGRSFPRPVIDDQRAARQSERVLGQALGVLSIVSDIDRWSWQLC